jgi:hypothetical protein
MARADTIRKLHTVADSPDLGAIAAKLDQSGNTSLIGTRELPMRSRFRLSSPPSPEAGYTLDGDMIMGTMVPAASVDHAGRFAELAMREQAEMMMRRLAARRLAARRVMAAI